MENVTRVQNFWNFNFGRVKQKIRENGTFPYYGSSFWNYLLKIGKIRIKVSALTQITEKDTWKFRSSGPSLEKVSAFIKGMKFEDWATMKELRLEGMEVCKKCCGSWKHKA